MKTIKLNFPTPVEATAHHSAARNLWIYGTVYSIEPTREMFFLHQSQDDNDRIVHWHPQTRILHHGAEVTPQSLHQGQQISVQFASDAGLTFAKEINIVVEPPLNEAAREILAEESRSLCHDSRGKRSR